MSRLVIFLSILTFLLLHSCSGKSAFSVEDEMMGGKTKVAKITTFWPSLETTSRSAKKKSEGLRGEYYSLFYKPSYNELNVTSISGNVIAYLNVKDAKSTPKINTTSQFKGVNIYKLYFDEALESKLEKLIERKAKKVKTITIKDQKVTESPETLVLKIIKKKIKETLIDMGKTKYIDKDYTIKSKFIVTKVYDFKYKNTRKTMEFKFDFLFTSLSAQKPDYAANLDSIEESIATSMENGSFKEAQKLNEIYKGIAPDKNKYYENAVKISLKLADKMAAVLSLIEQIETMDNEVDMDKKGFLKIKDIFKDSLKRRAYYKASRELNKSYKKYARNKISKQDFAAALKNLVIEFSLE